MTHSLCRQLRDDAHAECPQTRAVHARAVRVPALWQAGRRADARARHRRRLRPACDDGSACGRDARHLC
eukprot:335544-Pleurochrysis_carterae.AAC.1